jgi:CRISPR-associated protein Cas2
MYYLVCYDISDDRIRYRVVKVLKGVGVRIQKSVFECAELTEKQFLEMKDRLEALIDHTGDSIYYIRLCRACCKEVEWSGLGRKPQIESFRVV